MRQPKGRSCRPLSPLVFAAELSAKVWQGLLKIGMIDRQGNVLEDPR